MRILSALLLAAALPVFGETPQLRSTAPLTLTGKDPLQRLALPFEAYRDARNDLADVRVLNGKGEAVPMAWAADAQPTRDASATLELPVFPITRPGTASQPLGAEITVRASDGTLVAVKPRSAAVATPPRATSYVLDASKVEAPLRALVFDWKSGPGAQVVNVRVEASDDLKYWSGIAASPIVRIEAADKALSQPRVEFAPRKVRYLRVTWSGAEFALHKVSGETEPQVRPVPYSRNVVAGIAGEKPGEFLYDLGARLPVETLRLVLPERNSVVSAGFYARDDPKAEWRYVGGGAFYRLQREGGEVMAPPAPIGRHLARYWRVRLAAGSSPGAAPALETQWRSSQIVFVAQGEGPFSIAFGNDKLGPAALPVSTLIPGYEPLAELKLPEARAGVVLTGPVPSPLERLTYTQVDWKRIALWGVLIAGVAMLGFMATRLMKQLPR